MINNFFISNLHLRKVRYRTVCLSPSVFAPLKKPWGMISFSTGDCKVTNLRNFWNLSSKNRNSEPRCRNACFIVRFIC